MTSEPEVSLEQLLDSARRFSSGELVAHKDVLLARIARGEDVEKHERIVKAIDVVLAEEQARLDASTDWFREHMAEENT